MGEKLGLHGEGRWVARRVCAGMLARNHARDFHLLGDDKHSGNGREMGEFGLDEYLESEGIAGCGSSSTAN